MWSSKKSQYGKLEDCKNDKAELAWGLGMQDYPFLIVFGATWW